MSKLSGLFVPKLPVASLYLNGWTLTLDSTGRRCETRASCPLAEVLAPAR